MKVQQRPKGKKGIRQAGAGAKQSAEANAAAVAKAANAAATKHLYT